MFSRELADNMIFKKIFFISILLGIRVAGISLLVAGCVSNNVFDDGRVDIANYESLELSAASPPAVVQKFEALSGEVRCVPRKWRAATEEDVGSSSELTEPIRVATRHIPPIVSGVTVESGCPREVPVVWDLSASEPVAATTKFIPATPQSLQTTGGLADVIKLQWLRTPKVTSKAMRSRLSIRMDLRA